MEDSEIEDLVTTRTHKPASLTGGDVTTMFPVADEMKPGTPIVPQIEASGGPAQSGDS